MQVMFWTKIKVCTLLVAFLAAKCWFTTMEPQP